MKKILTILAITVPVLCGNTQAGPKFKSYVEMQAERRAKADAVSARYDAERKIAAENALAEKARVAQLKWNAKSISRSCKSRLQEQPESTFPSPNQTGGKLQQPRWQAG
jgi:hypothetical protein